MMMLVCTAREALEHPIGPAESQGHQCAMEKPSSFEAIVQKDKKNRDVLLAPPTPPPLLVLRRKKSLDTGVDCLAALLLRELEEF